MKSIVCCCICFWFLDSRPQISRSPGHCPAHTVFVVLVIIDGIVYCVCYY